MPSVFLYRRAEWRHIFFVFRSFSTQTTFVDEWHLCRCASFWTVFELVGFRCNIFLCFRHWKIFLCIQFLVCESTWMKCILMKWPVLCACRHREVNFEACNSDFGFTVLLNIFVCWRQVFNKWFHFTFVFTFSLLVTVIQNTVFLLVLNACIVPDTCLLISFFFNLYLHLGQ